MAREPLNLTKLIAAVAPEVARLVSVGFRIDEAIQRAFLKGLGE